jgi:hypothetical protein
MFFAILKNEFDNHHLHWENACIKHKINYNIIDLTTSQWINEILKEKYDVLLACPPGRESHYKQLYDEKIYVLETQLNYFIAISAGEILLEEKKYYAISAVTPMAQLLLSKQIGDRIEFRDSKFTIIKIH